MPLKFNIITNVENGYGLQNDYQIVKSLLETWGHSVAPVQYDHHLGMSAADINIFLETIIPVFGWAKENWYFPNPEWFTPQVDDRNLPYFKHVLCKTKDAYNLFKLRVGTAVFIGFESRDRSQLGTLVEKKYLHVAGQSVIKNTEEVIDAWQKYRIPKPLTIIATKYHYFKMVTSPHITLIRERIPDEEYEKILNTHFFHICPSKYEGWGHSLHEARSVGAVIITTDAPPMNEYGFTKDCLVPSRLTQQMRLATLHHVEAGDIAASALSLACQPIEYLSDLANDNRRRFIQDRNDFRVKFKQIVDDAEARICGD
jgi:hypothetical protein